MYVDGWDSYVINNDPELIAHVLTLAIFGSHSITIEPICTPFAVGTISVSHTLQAFPGDRVTVSSLRGVDITIAVTQYTGFPGHCWVSIVTIGASVSKMKNRIK